MSEITEGSEKQISWANEIQQTFRAKLASHIEIATALQQAERLVKLNEVTDMLDRYGHMARFWIDVVNGQDPRSLHYKVTNYRPSWLK